MTHDPELNQGEGQEHPQQTTDRDMAARNYLNLDTSILLGILFIAIVFRFHKITFPLVDGFSLCSENTVTRQKTAATMRPNQSCQQK
ncbi:hypothetical protein ACC771_14830, partial [Rhizobium ruizarguesonis]